MPGTRLLLKRARRRHPGSEGTGREERSTVSVALKSRSLRHHLRLHPPRLCRLAGFLIQTNVTPEVLTFCVSPLTASVIHSPETPHPPTVELRAIAALQVHAAGALH